MLKKNLTLKSFLEVVCIQNTVDEQTSYRPITWGTEDFVMFVDYLIYYALFAGYWPMNPQTTSSSLPL